MVRLALDRALAVLGRSRPGAAARAAAALDLLLGEPAAGGASTLTGGGYPVELAFTSAGGDLRYTVETDCGRVSPAARTGRALAALAPLAPAAGELPARLAPLLRLQAGADLAYGAWIAGRHGAGGDSFKLYLEAPGGCEPEAQRLVDGLLGAGPLLTRGAPRLRMAGWEPAAGRVELYFRADGLEPWEVHRLAGRLGLAASAEALLELAGELAGRPVSERLPCRAAGFSLSTEPAVLTLFFAARGLAGNDQRIRRRLLATAGRRGWHLPGYAAVTASLAGHAGRPTHHGMVSLVATAAGLHLGVGVQPPSPVGGAPPNGPAS